jgi:hypothetical protein
MAHEIWNMPSARRRRWGHRNGSGSHMRVWARYVVWILLISVGTTLLWERGARLLHPGRKSWPPETSVAVPSEQPETAAWQRDVASSLEAAGYEATSGNITQAEVGIDRAATFVTAAKFRSDSVAPDFFERTSGQLDRAVARAPQNARLAEHATLMRIELAQLRSALAIATADSRSLQKVAINSPYSIPRDFTFDPSVLRGNFVDATLMPSSAEILEPPFSRLFFDNVRVENLTLAGAAQTLDGIHWSNVTFIGTRLRYQGGDLDLQHAHFVRCTFGFVNGDRGARLATAIALGQSSVSIP